MLFLISAVAGIEFGAELIDEWGTKILASAFAQVSLLAANVTQNSLKHKSVGFTHTFGGNHKFGKYPTEKTQRTQTTHTEINLEMVS